MILHTRTFVQGLISMINMHINLDSFKCIIYKFIKNIRRKECERLKLIFSSSAITGIT